MREMIDDRFGWRARIGLLVPAGNTSMEMELNAARPRGVSFLATRMPIRSTTASELALMAERAQDAAACFRNIGCDGIVFGCTSGSFIKGLAWEKQLTVSLSETVGCPAISTSEALLKAIAALSKRRISLLTPYTKELNILEKRFFESAGLTVISEVGFGQVWNIGDIPLSRIYRAAMDVVQSDTELLLLSCTDLHTFSILDALEKDLGIPVISSNQATLWASLRMCRVKESIQGFGSLLTCI